MSDAAETQETLYPLEKSLSARGYRRSWRGRVETVRSLEHDHGLEERLREEFNVPESSFDGEGVRLRARKPVTIAIRRGEQLWFAENERLDIFATGATIEAAVHEFETLLVLFYEHYKTLKTSRASAQARRLKRVFGEGFVEVP
jgi:hypothetical protein